MSYFYACLLIMVEFDIFNDFLFSKDIVEATFARHHAYYTCKRSMLETILSLGVHVYCLSIITFVHEVFKWVLITTTKDNALSSGN